MLDVKEIDVAYGHAKVLHDVSVRLNEGETVFIVGRNGAGKTTLLRTIAGLLHPTKGTIAHEGQEIQGFAPEVVARRGIRYVAQDKKVFSNLTVRGNVELAASGMRNARLSLDILKNRWVRSSRASSRPWVPLA